MKKILPMRLFFILFFIISSCNSNAQKNVIYIDDANIKSILNKPKNLVFIWTTWCGVSTQILKETYSHLNVKDSLTNIIIICGNDNANRIEQFFEKEKISHPIYILKKSSNISPFFDRQNIKSFVTQEFKDPKKLSEPKLEGYFFSIPLTMLIDNNLVILNANMPQDTSGIYSYIKNY